VVVAARRHFLAHGFRGVTMDDLALELGMSKRTLYQQFSSKEKLVEAVLANKFRDMDVAFRQITSCCAEDFLGALHRLLGTLQQQAGEIQPPFVRDIQRSAPELFQIVENRRTELIRRHFGTLFAEGRRAGMIRTDIPARVAIAILLGAVQSVVNPRTMGELNITPQAGVSAVITVVLEGLVTRKRRGKK
jgi:AcrR family transcriptional regulator